MLLTPRSAVPLFVSRRRASVAVLAIAASTLPLLACAVDATDDEPMLESTGGESTSDELATEAQLNGRSLPAKTIVLTFDDGPGERTGELAAYLKEQGIPATFFMNGMQKSGREAQLQAVIENGHVLANHTQNHKQLTRLSAQGVRGELQPTDDIIKTYQPDGPWLLRAPYGAWNRGVSVAVNASDNLQKYTGSIFWDVGGQTTSGSAADWECWGAKKYTPARCAELYLSEVRTRGRGIVLMHDIHNKTVDMVKLLVPSLKREGYRFVNLTEVPSIVALMGQQPEDLGDSCQSATLGRSVDSGVCVQSASTEKWNLCNEGDWKLVASLDACTEKHAL